MGKVIAHPDVFDPDTAVPPASALHYSMEIAWDPQDRIYAVTVPELPGCQTHGATYEEAVRQGQDAIETWVAGAIEDGQPLPAARTFAAA